MSVLTVLSVWLVKNYPKLPQNYQKRSKNYLTANYANYANFFWGSTIIDNLRQLKSPNGKFRQEKRYVYQRSGLYSVRRSL